MVGVQGETNPVAAQVPVHAATRPGTSKDVRSLIPPLGLREYWYPAIEDKKVKNKPVGLKLLGDDVVFFRGKSGVAALWNVCPHRGGSLMHGDCHFEGTISCPYHGWTYDEDGNVLAVLPEGPESKIPGKVKARKYPTVTLKGMVFIWMGDEEPAPIEEDVPPEFFDDYTLLMFYTEYWPVNWNVALENGVDAHVPYVHRNSFRQFMFPVSPAGPRGSRNSIINGRAVVPKFAGGGAGSIGNSDGRRFKKVFFPALNAMWPKRELRYWFNWMFIPAARRQARKSAWDAPEEWTGGHHLPGMYRGDQKNNLYTRNAVPVTEELSRQVYFKAVRPKTRLGRVYERLHFWLSYRWVMFVNFSTQDFRVVGPQRYDAPEYLSATDSHQVLWRRIILQARGMMPPEEAKAVAYTPAEEFSFDRQEELGETAERV